MKKIKAERPVIRLNLTTADFFLFTATFIVNAALWWYIIDIYTSLNSEIPTHYSLEGGIDSTGAKSTIFILPAVSLVTNLLLYIISFFPHTFNYPVKITEQNAAHQYRLGVNLVRWLGFILSVFFAFVTYMTVQTAAGKATGPGKWAVAVFVGLTTIMLIAYFVMAERKK